MEKDDKAEKIMMLSKFDPGDKEKTDFEKMV